MFTYDIQYGGEPYDNYEFMGQTDLDCFLSVVDNFPWIDEMEKANARPQGSSPTISLQNTTDKKEIWISMAGDRINHGYLVGYSYLRSKRTWLGKIRYYYWLEIYLTEDMLMIKHYLQLYFAGEYDALHAKIKQLPLFKELKAPSKNER